jgi:hypothetical protein
MDQTAFFSSSSTQVAVLPKVFTSQTVNMLSPEPVPLQASPLPSPTQLSRRPSRSRSRSQLSSRRASLESILEESSNDNFEYPATHATSNPSPDFTGEKERIRLTVSRPPGWNGKKGISRGRGMHDVCGIWYAGYSTVILC